MKWTTKEGKELDIKEMDTKHIENCIKYCKKNNGKEYFEGVDGIDLSDVAGEVKYMNYDDEIEAFENELRLRKIEEKL